MNIPRKPMPIQYGGRPDQQWFYDKQFNDQQAGDRFGDRASDYERGRMQQELNYQRGQIQGSNAFDANQRALTGSDSTGALWGAAFAMNDPTRRPSSGISTMRDGFGGAKDFPSGGGASSPFTAANQAYQSETQRQALSGLTSAFQGLAGGASGGQAPGLNISGPNGPIASVNYQTSINPQQQVYNPQQGMQQMQAAPPQARGPGGQAFANNYAGMGQANAVNFGRAGTQAQGQYNADATQAQQQGALAGLGQQNRAAANQGRRKAATFGMGTNMMSGLLK
jgi:hypothetical protein